jgi:hypothetical protein
MIADIGIAARPAHALKLASAAIYGDLASHQSVTLSLQPTTLGKVDTLDPQAKFQVRLSFQRYRSLHTE